MLLTMLAMALGVGLIIPLLPVYASEMGASGLWIGLIFGANPLIRGVFTLFLGSLSDRMDKKKLILAGLTGYTLVAFGFIASTLPWHLFVMRVFQGAFSAAVQPVARAYAGRLTPRGSEGRVMGLFNLAFFAGFALGPLTGGLMADTWGIAAPFLGMAALSALAAALAAFYVPSQLPLRDGNGQLLQLRRGVDLRPLSDRHVLGMIVGRSMLAVGRGIFSTLMPIFGESVLALGAAQIGLVVTLRSTLESTLQAPMGKVADMFDRRLISIVCFTLIPLSLALIPMATSHRTLILFSALMGLGSGAGVPAVTAMAVEKGRTWGMGSLMGLEGVAMSFGMAFGSSFSGALMEATSVLFAFRAAAVVGVLGILTFARLTQGYRAERVAVEEVTAVAPVSRSANGDAG